MDILLSMKTALKKKKCTPLMSSSVLSKGFFNGSLQLGVSWSTNKKVNVIGAEATNYSNAIVQQYNNSQSLIS